MKTKSLETKERKRLIKEIEEKQDDQPIRIESSDEEPGRCEPDQPKDFDHEPTIDELNDGNDTRDGGMKDPEDRQHHQILREMKK